MKKNKNKNKIKATFQTSETISFAEVMEIMLGGDGDWETFGLDAEEEPEQEKIDYESVFKELGKQKMKI